LLEETRKISHSYSGIWRNGNKRAPSLRETSKEEGQQQANVFQLQGAWTLCEGMSRTKHAKGNRSGHLSEMQPKGTLYKEMRREKHFKTSENGIIEEVVTARRRPNKV
jgi:hypothetical protein